MGNFYDDAYSNYMDPFDVDHNPFNLLSTTEFYFYSLIAIIGVCILVWAGYLQYKGKSKDVLFGFIGIIAIGFSFVNISSVRFSELSVFFGLGFFIIHFIVCWLIVEGSTRIFIRRNEKSIKNRTIY